jgi:signal transduction histidine kinase
VFYYLKLKTLNTELEALNTTKNKFFAIIAHDLKGAVSSFSGITAIIKNHLDRGRPERVLKIASEVESSSDQLDGLLSNLLSWSFTQLNTVPYQPEIVDVGALLTGLADSVKIRTESKNIDLKINSHTSAKVFADPNGVLFIIRNLVSNAIKFSPSNSQIELLVTGANKTICISIIDKGIGMSEKEKNSLFNLSLKHSTKGTAGEKGSGLGLILCKEFTELNRGKLTLESEKNKGTTVNVVLPKS